MEAYVAIIVGCVPAVASLWKNVLSNSFIFTTLMSFASSIASRSRSFTSMGSNIGARSAVKTSNFGSSRHLHKEHYFELNGLCPSNQPVSTEICFSGNRKTSSPEGNVMTKSMSLEQMSVEQV